MSSIVAVFDWDGVVIDSSTAHERAWQSLAKENLPLVPNHFKLGFGKLNEVIIPNILGWTKDPKEIRRLSERKKRITERLLEVDILDCFLVPKNSPKPLNRWGIPCVIGTSTHKANLALSFELFGLARSFSGSHFKRRCDTR
jgi:beta-phosphoglucomutase-like phosphatase (HAD superfamily)